MAGIVSADWQGVEIRYKTARMRQRHITLGFGLLLAMGWLAILGSAPPLTSGALCPDLALSASPARLVSQVQIGLAEILGCGEN